MINSKAGTPVMARHIFLVSGWINSPENLFNQVAIGLTSDEAIQNVTEENPGFSLMSVTSLESIEQTAKQIRAAVEGLGVAIL